jgi:hypothetical protein
MLSSTLINSVNPPNERSGWSRPPKALGKPPRRSAHTPSIGGGAVDSLPGSRDAGLSKLRHQLVAMHD